MDDQIVSVGYSLRFKGALSQLTAFDVEFPEVEIESRRPYRKDPSKYVFVFPLTEQIDLKKLKSFAEKNGLVKEFDLFMAIDSGTDNYIIDMPDYVLTALRELPVRVCVSFMYCESGDEGE